MSLVLLILATASCARAVGGPWRGETGIYGTYHHFGPSSYLCGVAYDLRYEGPERLDSVEVAARFPSGLAARVPDSERARVSGPVRPPWSVPATFNGRTLPTATEARHVSGDIGTICANGPSDLEALRGTTLDVTWTVGGVERAQRIVVDDVRGDLMVFMDVEGDGQARVVWRDRRDVLDAAAAGGIGALVALVLAFLLGTRYFTTLSR